MFLCSFFENMYVSEGAKSITIRYKEHIGAFKNI